MRKHFHLGCVVLLLTLIVLAYSCKNDNSGTGSTNAAAATTTAATTESNSTEQSKGAAIAGVLDTLWTDTTAFNAIPNGRKTVFSFTFRDPDTLTLFGWYCKNATCAGNFDPDPNIKLTKGKASPVKYGPNVILGNVMIQTIDIVKIKRAYGGKFNYILFAPQTDGDYIKYKVFLTNDSPIRTLDVGSVEDTGVELNPSPPRN